MAAGAHHSLALTAQSQVSGVNCSLGISLLAAVTFLQRPGLPEATQNKIIKL